MKATRVTPSSLPAGSPIDNGLGSGALDRGVSRIERVHLRGREPLGIERRARSGRVGHVGRTTLRSLKPSEFPLAEPYRIKVVKATDKSRLTDYAADMPEREFKKETLELINATYPDEELKPGQLFKIVE